MRTTVFVRAGVALTILFLAQLAVVVATERSAAAMTAAAQALVASLGAEQRAVAVFDYASDERHRWHFIPSEMFPRKGVPLRSMSADQKAKAHALLQTGLSHQGYLTATAIIQLEDTLRAIENSQRFARSPLDYQFTVFGAPGARAPWGWRVEGHHLSLHFSVANGRVTATSPTFTGATPAGLPGSAMTPPQKAALMTLVTSYVSLVADDLAAERMSRLTAGGLDRLTFAWAGPTARGAKHYYRVQGPTFLIEYDNTQNDGNHIHAVWRDFAGDFGRDVLREHLRADHPQ